MIVSTQGCDSCIVAASTRTSKLDMLDENEIFDPSGDQSESYRL
jgi:hypothetical protein